MAESRLYYIWERVICPWFFFYKVVVVEAFCMIRHKVARLFA
jgi:hypothetical protein